VTPVPVVDSHVHFWDPAELEYPWLADLPPLLRAFGPEEYREAARDIPVESALFVEANPHPARGAAEARRVQRLAASHPWIAGVVAFVDLTATSAAPALDELADVALVRGIRHNIQGNAPGFALQPAYVEGVREAGRRGLVVDLCVTHDQLPEAILLVDHAPDTRFVLDHCAKPAIRDRLLDPWRADLARLAERPNVSCKISGLLSEAEPGIPAEELLPYAAHVVEVFGTGRVMYGSDWPVLTLAGSHSGWYDFTRLLTRGWSDEEVRRFYRENARSAYSLPSVADSPEPLNDRV
jgi:L-fuconolactonase